MGALSQQLPLRLMDELIPQAFIVVWNSWLQYWLPRSLWKIKPASGLRRNHAMRSASMTSSRRMCGFIDQPTLRRIDDFIR